MSLAIVRIDLNQTVFKRPKMNPIMTTKEAAEMLGIKTDMVRRWCREGYLPAVQLGREYRISRAALIDWWEEKGGGRLEFDTFYSVGKDEQKTEDNAKKGEQKADEVAEKEDIKQKVIERRIIRGR